MLKHVFCVLLCFFSLAALAESCPENIQYTGGNYLKRGKNFYYRAGSYVLRDNMLYYPNGNYLKRDANVYYANGSYLQRGSDLYFPNGNYLRRGTNYYYSNGNYLKRDQYFFYPNGSYARRNGKLYRADGSETPFPVYLGENIAGLGYLRAYVQSNAEQVDLELGNLLFGSADVAVSGFWDGNQFAEFRVGLNTGVTGENVYVLIKGGQVTCQLGR